jgi:hypothetical protein
MRAHARARTHAQARTAAAGATGGQGHRATTPRCSSGFAPARVRLVCTHPHNRPCRNPSRKPQAVPRHGVHARSCCCVRRSARAVRRCARPATLPTSARCAVPCRCMCAPRRTACAGCCILHYVASCTLHLALRCIVHSVACADCARVIGSGEAEEEAGNELAEQNM